MCNVESFTINLWILFILTSNALIQLYWTKWLRDYDHRHSYSKEENESWIAMWENIWDTQKLNGNNTEDIDQ